jgi:uncharacterized protein (DUF1778 family)
MAMTKRKPKKDRKEIVLRVLVTAEQHRQLKTAAELHGLSLSAWMRTEALRIARERPEGIAPPGPPTS